jgi:hypothetical protein
MIAVLAVINYRTPFFSTRWRRMVMVVVEILVIQEVWKAREKHIYSIEQLETKK